MIILNQQLADEIRAKYETGDVFHRELAEEYGVDTSHITKIIDGKHWKPKKEGYKKPNLKMKRLATRFWSQVDKSGECWEWLGPKKSNGYGILTITLDSGKRESHVHRISYILEYGEIPDGLCVLHKCDNRSCVRPSHLWLGTYGDNNRDAIAKGRFATPPNFQGEHHPSAKLTQRQVDEIRQLGLKHPGLTYVAIAKRYDVTPENISHIVRHISWNN